VQRFRRFFVIAILLLNVTACATGSSESPTPLNPTSEQALTKTVDQTSSWNWANIFVPLGLVDVTVAILAF
jgi:hypothetical protein